MFCDGSINARLAHFDAAHGESVEYQGWYRFADGAARETNPWGALMEPPRDAWERAKLIALFHKVRLYRAVERFDELKKALQTHAVIAAGGNAPPPTDADIARLEQEKTRVETLRRAYEAAQRAADDAEPVERKRARETQAELQQQAQAALERVRAITV